MVPLNDSRFKPAPREHKRSIGLSMCECKSENVHCSLCHSSDHDTYRKTHMLIDLGILIITSFFTAINTLGHLHSPVTADLCEYI